MPEIVLHHLEQSRSHRILWLLEELEVPYAFEVYKRHPKTMRAPKELRDLHPLGKAPIVQIDGRTYAETAHVIEAILDAVPSALRPEMGTTAYDDYRYWLHYAEGSLMPPLLLKLITTKAVSGSPWFARPLVRGVTGAIDKAFTNGELTLHEGYLNSHLGSHSWFVGDTFSAADIQMSYGTEALLLRGSAQAPHIQAWLDRVRARPAYQRAIDKGGPTFG